MWLDTNSSGDFQTSLEPISETLIEALGHKTPSVRSETAAFLARSFAFCTMTTLPKKMLKAFIAPLLKVTYFYRFTKFHNIQISYHVSINWHKNQVVPQLIIIVTWWQTINDTTPDVREASYEALGTAMKVVGEKPIMPFLSDVDNIKLQKVNV